MSLAELLWAQVTLLMDSFHVPLVMASHFHSSRVLSGQRLWEEKTLQTSSSSSGASRLALQSAFSFLPACWFAQLLPWQ